ncbi:class I adenylate-forming enzyme family protein [Spirillospora sp. CA-142024]|uniref:class I adenylate-forming enzyme family protein n=1 Tax=Spirillospora sp. CA-142024 TaxID=3240036 RepID=UPI003D933E2E
MLTEALDEAVRRYGRRPALRTPEGAELSYADLGRLTDETAAGLARRGVREGQVAALLLPASVEYVVAYLALARLGAITAGVNPRLTAPEGRAVLDRARPDVVIGTAELVAERRGAAETIEVPLAGTPEAVLAGLRDDRRAPPAVRTDPDRPVAIVFTSGSTGTPKGAVFAGRQLRAIASIDAGGPRPAPPVLAGTELPHVGFMTKLPGHLLAGARVQLLRRWRAADVLRLVAEQRMPVIGGVSAQVALLLRVPEFGSHDLSAVRALVVGGGPSPPELVRRARTRFGAAYSIRYSSTESGGVGTMTAFDGPDEEALHTVGRPRPGIDIEIRDDRGRALPPGEVGQIFLRSPATMTGYWRDEAATRAALSGGFLRTGDLGVVDDRGCLRLAGRHGEMYIRGGYNVHPQEVEAVLAECPGVAAVAVAPTPDAVMGEIGVAVVVPADPGAPPGLDELRAFAAGRLARHKLPEELLVVAELPLTSMYKIDRRALAGLVTRAGTPGRSPHPRRGTRP